MRSLCTESLQGEHSGVNRLNVNNSIISISVKKKERKKENLWLQKRNQQLYFDFLELAVVHFLKQSFLTQALLKISLTLDNDMFKQISILACEKAHHSSRNSSTRIKGEKILHISHSVTVIESSAE